MSISVPMRRCTIKRVWLRCYIRNFISIAFWSRSQKRLFQKPSANNSQIYYWAYWLELWAGHHFNSNPNHQGNAHIPKGPWLCNWSNLFSNFCVPSVRIASVLCMQLTLFARQWLCVSDVRAQQQLPKRKPKCFFFGLTSSTINVNQAMASPCLFFKTLSQL